MRPIDYRHGVLRAFVTANCFVAITGLQLDSMDLSSNPRSPMLTAQRCLAAKVSPYSQPIATHGPHQLTVELDRHSTLTDQRPPGPSRQTSPAKPSVFSEKEWEQTVGHKREKRWLAKTRCSTYCCVKNNCQSSNYGHVLYIPI